MQVADEPGRIREALFVPGKAAKAVHIVNVEVDRLAGDVALSVLARDLAHTCFGDIAPPVLVVPERPQRGHDHASRQLCIPFQHGSELRAVEKVGAHFAALGFKAGDARRPDAKVKAPAGAVVKKDAVSTPIDQAEVKGDGRVDRVVAGAVGLWIGIPHVERVPALVEGGGLFAQPIDVLVGGHLFPAQYALAAQFPPRSGGIGVDQRAVGVEVGDR